MIFEQRRQIRAYRTIDIDLLYEAIQSNSSDRIFDLNDDSTLNSSDVDELVHVILSTTYGDANLDGSVDAVDLAVVRTYIGIGNPSIVFPWMFGNFNGDHFVDADDLAEVRNNFGFAAPGPQPVPEASTTLLLAVGLASLCRHPRYCPPGTCAVEGSIAIDLILPATRRVHRRRRCR